MAGWMIVNMLVSRRAAEVVRSLAALECAVPRDPVMLEELRSMTDLTDDQWVLVLTELDVTGYGEFYRVWGIQAVRLTREPVLRQPRLVAVETSWLAGCLLRGRGRAFGR